MRDGDSNDEVARQLKITAQTVGKWRRRFVSQRMEGLLDEPRVGAPRKILDADVERVLTLTLESKPKDATHWSTRSMAEASGLTQTAVSRVWRAFALQPIGQRLSSYRKIRSSSRRFETLSVST